MSTVSMSHECSSCVCEHGGEECQHHHQHGGCSCGGCAAGGYSGGYGMPNNNIGTNAPNAATASNVVSGAGSKSYRQKLADHYREKSMTPDDIREVNEGRIEAGSGVLEGTPDGENCCIRDNSISGIGAGVHTAVYCCNELYAGQCKWRVCAEPSTECMYKIDYRINVKESRDPNSVAKNILIHSCVREEARAEADVVSGMEQ